MISFKDVKFEEFKELILFLKFNDEETEYHNITKRLTRFIEEMNAYQSVLIDNIVKDILEGKEKDAHDLFDTFQKTYPNIKFDPEGKLDLTDFNYFEISLQSIDMLFSQAKEKIENNSAEDIDFQIYNAKTLEPLLNLNGRFEYPLKKFMYFKNNSIRPITKENFKKIEIIINELFPEENNILGKFLNYIYYKKYEKCITFIEHFLYRIDILYKDKELTHNSNKEFYELLKQL